MENRIEFAFWRLLVIPVLMLTFVLLPLLFILVMHYYSPDLILFSLINSIIVFGAMLMNLFIFQQLGNSTHKALLYSLVVLNSAGFTLSGLFYSIFAHPLFFIYGARVSISFTFILFSIITSLSLFSGALFRYQKNFIREREAGETERRLREEMERLVYSARISPHFLFNSLNLLVSQLDNQEKAESILIDLSNLLRLSLEMSKRRSIPINEEIQCAKLYLRIQKERFGSRLTYQIRGESMSLIPPLILQPLAENSIKHNLNNCRLLNIQIDIADQAEWVIITIVDSQKKLTPQMLGRGNGMDITRRRVELVGGEFTVQDGGVRICLPR